LSKSETYHQINRAKRTGGVALVIEHLLSKSEAMSSNPNTTHTHKKKEKESKNKQIKQTKTNPHTQVNRMITNSLNSLEQKVQATRREKWVFELSLAG
jgi:dihydroxyacid dehydratase/phosphogluconate dehydratase